MNAILKCYPPFRNTFFRFVTEADRENLCEDVFERITEEIAEQWNLLIAMVFHNSKSEVTHSNRRTVELAT